VLASGRGVALADETVLISRDNAEIAVSGSGTPIRDSSGDTVGAIVVFRDASRDIEVREHILRVNRQEVLAQLAKGVAHHFNDLLTGILGNVTLAKMNVSPGSSISEMLADAEAAAMQAKKLTQQLLSLAGSQGSVREVTALDPLLEDSVNFALRGSAMRSEIEVADDLWPVDLDKTQMTQAIANLVINAAEAMAEGGTVRVKAENVTVNGG